MLTGYGPAAPAADSIPEFDGNPCQAEGQKTKRQSCQSSDSSGLRAGHVMYPEVVCLSGSLLISRLMF